MLTPDAVEVSIMGRDDRKAGERAEKLARAISKGDISKARRVLEKHRHIDFQHRTPLGATLLHLAATAKGGATLIDELVSRGCCANAADATGSTPLHVAGPAAVHALLSSADAHEVAVELTAVNRDGLSVDDAVWLTLCEEASASEEEGSGGYSAAAWADAGFDADADGARRRHDSDAAWCARLAEESRVEEGEASGTGLDWADAGGGGGGGRAEASTDDDDWFGAIAAQRAARDAARAREARERAEAFAAARDAERRRWQGAADAAADERARRHEEARSRAAALGVAEAEAAVRQRYLDACAALAQRAAGWEDGRPPRPLRTAELPWPTRDGAPPSAARPISAQEVAAIVLTRGMSAVERRKALQAEQRKWHPDKFEARWAAALRADERDEVLRTATQVSQALNELMQAP